MAAQHDLLREEHRQVAELEGWAIGDREVVAVGGIHLPAPLLHARSPAGAGLAHELRLGDALGRACVRDLVQDFDRDLGVDLARARARDDDQLPLARLVRGAQHDLASRPDPDRFHGDRLERGGGLRSGRLRVAGIGGGERCGSRRAACRRVPACESTHRPLEPPVERHLFLHGASGTVEADRPHALRSTALDADARRRDAERFERARRQERRQLQIGLLRGLGSGRRLGARAGGILAPPGTPVIPGPCSLVLLGVHRQHGVARPLPVEVAEGTLQVADDRPVELLHLAALEVLQHADEHGLDRSQSAREGRARLVDDDAAAASRRDVESREVDEPRETDVRPRRPVQPERAELMEILRDERPGGV